MRVEILLTDLNVSLDISEQINTNLNYSFDDLKNLNGRNSSGSINYFIPGTALNKYWFGNLFDINSTYTYFNPNRKVSCRILVDSNIVLDGFLKLNKIIDTQANEDIWFDVVFFDTVIDLRTELGDLTIADLDLREITHTLNKVNIEGSWAHDWSDGYVYPIYWGSDALYETKHFYAALFYKYVLYKTMDLVGFGATGSFFNNSDFDREILPYVFDEKRLIDDSEIERRRFEIGFTGSLNQFAGTISNTHNYMNLNVPFNNEVTPFYDNDNHWDTTLYEWDIDKNGDYGIEYKFKFDVDIFNSGSTVQSYNTFNNVTLFPRTDYEVICQINRGSGWIEVWDTKLEIGKSVPNTLNSGTSSYLGDQIVGRKLMPRNLNIGNKVRLIIRLKQNVSFFNYRTNSSTVVPQKLTINFKNLGVNLNSYIKNDPLIGELRDGDIVNFRWGSRIKLYDLLEDLKTRYNLIIYSDAKNSRLIHFEPYVSFFNGAPRVDWTDLIDRDYKENIVPLFDLKSKSIVLSYKDNDDEYSKYFKDVVGEPHLYKRITFGNDFVKGETRIETPFSEIPLIKNNYCDIVSPYLNRDLPRSKPTVQYWGGLKKAPVEVIDNPWWALKWIDDNGVVQQVVYDHFPYMGHFNNPWQPTYDIGFSKQPYYFIQPMNLTDNNIYNRHWDRYVWNIENSKLWKVRLKLTSKHIKDIREKPNTLIHIQDKWFYVKSINNFSPFEPLTECELIQFNEGLDFIPLKENSIITNYISNDIIIKGDRGDGNNYMDAGSVVIGRNNITRNPDIGATSSMRMPNSNIVVGDNNVVGDNSIVNGNGNVVGDNTLNIGNNNILSDNSYVIGGNDRIANDGDIWIGNYLNFNTRNGMVNYRSSYYVPDYITDGYFVEFSGSYGFQDFGTSSLYVINSNYIQLNGNVSINGFTFSGLTGLGGVLNIDNITDGNDIALTTGDKIVSDDINNTSISLDNGLVSFNSLDGIEFQYDQSLLIQEQLRLRQAELTTNDDNLTTLLSITVPNDTLISIEGVVKGIDIANGEAIFCKLWGAVINIGGSLGIIGGSFDFFIKSDISGGDVQTLISGTTFRIMIIGAPSDPVNWTFYGKTQII